MDEEGFREYLGSKVDSDAMERNIGAVREAEAVLEVNGRMKDFGQANLEDLKRVAQHSIKAGVNSWENFLALLRYARFAKNREVEIAMLELLDGSEVLGKLSEEVEKTFGEKLHAEVFDGVELPPLGTFPADKPATTKKLVERLEGKLGEEGCRKALLCGLHVGPEEEYLPEREAFLHSEGIDDFLAKRHERYVKELQQLMEEGSLYFTQVIDEEVLDYVKRTPTCQNGVRRGGLIQVTKIPYMAKQYFKEDDERMKRYYYCHCPWAREGIRSGVDVSPNFCYCSAAFEKRPWDVIFGQSVKAEVVRSVLKGDLICEFAIHIPDQYMESAGLANMGERPEPNVSRVQFHGNPG